MTKAPTHIENSKNRSDNTKNDTKNFDYTMITDRLRMVCRNNDNHQTGVDKPVYWIPTLPFIAKAV